MCQRGQLTKTNLYYCLHLVTNVVLLTNTKIAEVNFVKMMMYLCCSRVKSADEAAVLLKQSQLTFVYN